MESCSAVEGTSTSAKPEGTRLGSRPCRRTCKRFRAQILSLGAATGGLAGGCEGAGATAQEQGKRPGPWLWQEWPWGAAAAEGGRHLDPLEGTRALPAGSCGPHMIMAGLGGMV